MARYARTLSTMFAAGVPLVEALESVAGATGNIVYSDAVLLMRDQRGHRPAAAVRHAARPACFPTWSMQMVAIGEESGALDSHAGQSGGFL